MVTNTKPNRVSGVVVAPTAVLRLVGGGSGHESLFGGEPMMSLGSARTIANLGIASALALFLAGCSSFSLTSSSPAPEPGVAPEVPATVRAEELVGKWGL